MKATIMFLFVLIFMVAAAGLCAQNGEDFRDLNLRAREYRFPGSGTTTADLFALNKRIQEYRRISMDYAAIATVYEEYTEAVNSGDARRWLALHEPEAYKMPQGQPMFRIADIAPTVQVQWDKGPRMEMDIDCREIVIRGDIAWAMGCYTETLIPNNGDPAQTFQGKFLTILRRQADGSWLIYRDSYSFDVPASL